MTGSTDGRTERCGESPEGLMFFQTSLTRARSEIDRASDIVEFSIVVVTRDKQLRNVDHSVFQQNAVVEFQFGFLPSFEESIRTGRAWGYAHRSRSRNPKTEAVWDDLVPQSDRNIVRFSPRGFGAASPPSFDCSVDAYLNWRVGELGKVAQPIDLVEHDWGEMSSALQWIFQF
ncbi:hypothetical protein [Bradyrhizobium sp. CCBAU 45394]|uniref:hypothetical protein n=1 Tax=Bradyrhizobium sp. CCBAU 45394 TaxID=1325087 RepID=UPI002304CC39|nr:hypothetical protein [Bradyrhizobium sp. CCBAU 45394]